MYRVRYAKRASDRYPAKEFLDWLEKKDGNSFDKFMRAFEKFQDHGPEGTVGIYKALQGKGAGLVQFTIWKYRVLGFRKGNEVFLTNGFKKDQDDTPQVELDRAFKVKSEHEGGTTGGKQ
ncbi:MAG TPA: type II toxin-antitoxin system RelE/ParE family toxin [Vicinamibacterales bacterium]|nr:type II toxin-antitoxin system RelE/ParE family toxin [Vicinamibacterales bacterium]